MADVDVAVQEDVGVGAAHKFEHLDPERGVSAAAVLQHAQGFLVCQHGAANGGVGGTRKQKQYKWDRPDGLRRSRHLCVFSFTAAMRC